MSGAVILTQEQSDLLSSDLSELIEKITNFEKELDPKTLNREIKESVLEALNEGSLLSTLKNEDFELEQNIKELKKIKKYFLECKNEAMERVVISSLFGVIVGAGIAIIILKFL